jgi:FKBP-type peptidyl-prolyl cis-trans isomerase
MALAVAWGLVACGEEGAPGESVGGTTASVEATDDSPGPRLEAPDAPPPERLVVRDLRVGGGRAAKAGDDVVLNYKGINWNGTSHGSSWTFPEPPEFRIGGRRLYLGIDFGIRAMREGGRRELRIPARLGFERGVEPWGPVGPDDSLLYIVDLVEVTEGSG